MSKLESFGSLGFFVMKGNRWSKPALFKEKFRKIICYAIMGLPLVGVVIADFLPSSARSQQFLVMIILIWIQVFFIFEVFMIGR